MIPIDVATVADLAAYWEDSVESDETHIAFAFWFVENLQARGYSITKMHE